MRQFLFLSCFKMINIFVWRCMLLLMLFHIKTTTTTLLLFFYMDAFQCSLSLFFLHVLFFFFLLSSSQQKPLSNFPPLFTRHFLYLLKNFLQCFFNTHTHTQISFCSDICLCNEIFFFRIYFNTFFLYPSMSIEDKNIFSIKSKQRKIQDFMQLQRNSLSCDFGNGCIHFIYLSVLEIVSRWKR